MKTRLQVLSVENKSGRSGSTGKDYSMDICQCVIHVVDQETGAEKLQIGELMLPKNHPKVSPGFYDAEFGISVSQEKKIGGRLIQLTPVANAQRVAAPAPSPSPAKV